MFRAVPIRVSMWRVGWMMLAFSLIASLVAISADHLISPGFALAAPSNGKSWVVLVVEYTGSFFSGWVGANGIWSKWRRRALTQAVAVAETPTTRTLWTWFIKQLVAGALFLVVGIWFAIVVSDTPGEEFHLISSLVLGFGVMGVSYLILAWRVGKLERAQSVVYYWQRQPGIVNFERVGVCAAPVYAVLW